MCSCRSALLALLLVLANGLAIAQPYSGIGRTATPKEVAAWDIDVRPDFKGLPPGSGTVARGQVIWEAQCASCHGVFGESNEVFTPLVGGTTARDIERGRVERLTDGSFPGRTTLMKLPTLSTLWDYIHRAMPWNAPKSLSADDVYAVTAFMLNLGGVVPDDFTLSDRNIRQVQQRLPNRNGMSTDHALWPGRGLPGQTQVPDVRNTACMANCTTEPRVASLLPDHARNAHGNLAEQNRAVGAQRGADTTRPAGAPRAQPARPAALAAPAAPAAPAALALARQHNCLACHGIDNRIVGPGLREIARKHAGRGDATAYLVQKINEGGAGVWGSIPMPAQTLPADDAKAIAQWLAAGAPR
jgi:S-disulfanyl-L-cysteine oxidoreductase SoxD